MGCRKSRVRKGEEGMTGKADELIRWLTCQDRETVFDITEHKDKRSLNANALLWKCLGEIAAALRTDKWEVYLTMLKRYGTFTYICVKPKAVEAVKRQWRECEVIGDISVNGDKAVQMLCYYGSSTMNTKEFSVLLDGVISEMKEMGLDTPSDRDLQRAIEQKEKENET
jgi:hypothetical protein